ncbi:purine-binding chemotaxis protein CheW [Endozoicomonas sp. SM1973]|uniref:Purine-binding chemotaxis protein CheW n=1 Tax=Spartinivicinus marinus TaxID=2994442 RepID=A0A853I504_9GAMM|nr:chemotaxis protein CheW [Spartinivicinus marinus]MCX4030078.1 chemotaxis protein CheW [Spartinivicinus marinus]NYZ64677.1 purine-binding chemotaxis protein CheW [Spartinivicinus marinus]
MKKVVMSKNTNNSDSPSPSSPPQQPYISANELLPVDDKQKSILNKRATELAETKTELALKSTNQEEYIRFKLGQSEQYGIPYHYLEEITYANNISKVPCVPSHIAGVINWRGSLLAVLNLAIFFNIEASEVTDDSRVIIVTASSITAGILVSEIEENNTYSPNMLAPPISSERVTNIDYVKGIYKGTITIIDLTAIFSDKALEVNQ